MFKILSSLLLLVSVGFSSTLWARDSKSKSPGFTSGAQGSFSLGMIRSALNLGGQFDVPRDGYDLGGYVFMQQSKDKNGTTNVYQLTSLGGQVKAHLNHGGVVDAYLAPGVGVHMIKDVPDGATKSDVSTIGPTLRIGALMQASPTMKVGLESFEVWNWLDEKALSSYEFYSLVLAVTF